jgi:phosphopantetheine adenylyltransferase
MPIPIIIAILVALFTLGTKMNQPKGNRAEVVILGGKPYNWVDKKDNRDNLVVMAAEEQDHTITIKGQRQSEDFENIFQLWSLYKIVNSEPITAINNSINQ